jgi:hypothetical protein
MKAEPLINYGLWTLGIELWASTALGTYLPEQLNARRKLASNLGLPYYASQTELLRKLSEVAYQTPKDNPLATEADLARVRRNQATMYSKAFGHPPTILPKDVACGFTLQTSDRVTGQMPHQAQLELCAALDLRPMDCWEMRVEIRFANRIESLFRTDWAAMDQMTRRFQTAFNRTPRSKSEIRNGIELLGAAAALVGLPRNAPLEQIELEYAKFGTNQIGQPPFGHDEMFFNLTGRYLRPVAELRRLGICDEEGNYIGTAPPRNDAEWLARLDET